MPGLAVEFRAAVAAALGISEAGERIRTLAQAGSAIHRQLTLSRLEALHEMAYLRVFVGWEQFIEASFLRMMCGYQSTVWTPAFAAGKQRQLKISAAEGALFGGRDYLLWHNPKSVRDRGHQWFAGGPHEAVAVSNFSRLESFAAVRHRIAHGSDDARRKFDAATMTLSGQRYRGGSAGKFLRSWNASISPAERWLNTIGDELASLAAQISP